MLKLQCVIQNPTFKNIIQQSFSDVHYNITFSKSLHSSIKNLNKVNIDLLCIDVNKSFINVWNKINKIKQPILWFQNNLLIEPTFLDQIKALDSTLDIFFYNGDTISTSQYIKFSLNLFIKRNTTIFLLKRKNDILLYKNKILTKMNNMSQSSTVRSRDNQVLSFLIGNSSRIKQLHCELNIAIQKHLFTLFICQRNNEETEIAQFIHEKKTKNQNLKEEEISFNVINFAESAENLHALQIEDLSISIENTNNKFQTYFLQNIDRLSWNNQHEIYLLIDKISNLKKNKSNTYSNLYIIFSLSPKVNKLIDKNQFRQNLFSKLNFHSIEIPTLNEREADIIFIIDAIVQKYKNTYKKIVSLSPYLKLFFLKKTWFDNYNDFYRFVHKVLSLLNMGLDNIDVITEHVLFIKEKKSFQNIITEFIKHMREKEKIIYEKSLHQNILSGSLQPKLADIEKMYILEIFSSQNNNYAKTARILGISRKTLYDKLQKNEI